MKELTDAEVRRIIAAVYPTRVEALLERLAVACYCRNETGLTGWFGDFLDRVKCANQRRRADDRRHLVGWRDRT